jgi:hypothetical protein
VVRTVLRNAMGISAIAFDSRPLVVQAGGYVVLQ